MFETHFARSPKSPPPAARLDTPFQSAVYAALRPGCLLDYESLFDRVAVSTWADGLGVLSRKAFDGVLAGLVTVGFAVEVSGYKLDGTLRR